jgi:CRP-like cAMP-binding protein
MAIAHPIDPLIASLSRRETLTSESIEALRSLSVRVKDFAPNEDLVRSGTSPHESCLVIAGFAARAQYLPNGGRQLDAVHLVGDFVDLHSMQLQVMDHSVTALGRCTAGYVPHQEIIAAMHAVPQLTWLFWQTTVTDAAIARTWITCLGRRSAEQNMAHLLCELYVRLSSLELVEGRAFTFPATQNDLADILGLSTVHVNRTLQCLRSQELVDWQAPRVQILDFDRLAAKAGFEDDYLLPGRPTPTNPPRLYTPMTQNQERR